MIIPVAADTLCVMLYAAHVAACHFLYVFLAEVDTPFRQLQRGLLMPPVYADYLRRCKRRLFSLMIAAAASPPFQAIDARSPAEARLRRVCYASARTQRAMSRAAVRLYAVMRAAIQEALCYFDCL